MQEVSQKTPVDQDKRKKVMSVLEEAQIDVPAKFSFHFPNTMMKFPRTLSSDQPLKTTLKQFQGPILPMLK